MKAQRWRDEDLQKIRHELSRGLHQQESPLAIHQIRRLVKLDSTSTFWNILRIINRRIKMNSIMMNFPSLMDLT